LSFSAAARIAAKCFSRVGAVIRPEFQNRQPLTGQVLLMAKVLVRDDEEVKTQRSQGRPAERRS
jgi:hypothetical protein